MNVTRVPVVAMTLLALTTNLAPAIGSAEQTETKAESRIVSVGLFKNGLAVVKRRVPIPAAGVYRIEDVPVPVHGTFWIESDAVVETRVTDRMVETTLPANQRVDFQTHLAGHKVTVTFREGETPPVSGRVVEPGGARGDASWDRTYQRQRRHWGYGGESRQSDSGKTFLVLATEEGQAFIDSSMIASLRTDKRIETCKRRRPVLLLDAKKVEKSPAVVFVSYLTKGMAWAPSYHVDISDPQQLMLRQKAVLKNELADILEADIQLISGFPSIEFSHVISPLSLQTTWSQFFNQLAREVRPGHGSGRQMVTQQRVMSNVAASQPMPDMSAIPMGRGVDLHYQPIGKRTLKEGDSLALPVASGKAPYERIVEWIVPDTRDANGRFISDHRRRDDPEKYQDAAWDAVRFKNPLEFPMTTAPAMITANGHFNGQQLSYWTNSGETTTLKVTKALSIRTRHVQHEEKGQRDIVYLGGNDYRQVNVKGQLTVNNHRQEAVTLVIRRRFSGDLLEADGDPTCRLRVEGVYSVNKRNELVWELTLQPGKEKTYSYRYAVLVDH